MFRNLFQRKSDEKNTPPEQDAPASETPPAAEPKRAGFFQRLKEGLAKTRRSLTSRLTGLLRFGRQIDESLYDELEELLIESDVGVETTMQLVERVRVAAKEKGLRDAGELQTVLREEISAILGEPVPLDVTTAKPYVLLVVGVNGVGKTTTIGKLAARYRGNGKKVLVAAGDTFRAAAIDQLEIWCERAGVDLVKQSEGADAASVVFDALSAARSRGSDLVIVDTAGRLHTKTNLMQELAKIGRIAGREIPGAPHEVLLVVDATTGQNAVVQAQKFGEIVNVTGIALTKLDSTAKGGIVIAVKSALGIPVKLIGIGEGVEDLRDFEPREFVDALFAQEDEEA